MPELPDVEGFRRHFARYGTGKPVAGVDVLDRELLRNAAPQALARALNGRSFERASRHGKWLIAETGAGPELLLHFGMTGLLHWSRDPGDRHAHDRLVLRFEDGELRYRNMRRFGGYWLARGRDERDAVTGALGPDAMDVDRDGFVELVTGRRGQVKPALMDQTLIAGLGNLLVDEILWRSRIHPRRAIGTLRERDLERMHDTMRSVLREANRHGRVPPVEGWLTKARDERDPRCPRCGARLRKAPVGGRTTTWCPRDQRG